MLSQHEHCRYILLRLNYFASTEFCVSSPTMLRWKEIVLKGEKIKRLFYIDNTNQNAVGFLKLFCFTRGKIKKKRERVLLSNSTVLTAPYGLFLNKHNDSTTNKMYPKFSSHISAKVDILIFLLCFRIQDIVIQQIQVLIYLFCWECMDAFWEGITNDT